MVNPKVIGIAYVKIVEDEKGNVDFDYGYEVYYCYNYSSFKYNEFF